MDRKRILKNILIAAFGGLAALASLLILLFVSIYFFAPFCQSSFTPDPANPGRGTYRCC